MTDIEAYYTEHLSTPGSVLVVSVMGEPGGMGVFSDLEMARAWADEQESPTLTVPYVINVPEFGNIPYAESN